MGIDRERKPRKEFFRKEKPVRTQVAKVPGSKSMRDMTTPPKTGPIKIFLDDERPAPAGFVVARSLPAFRHLLDTIDLSRLHTICLDWHLGINAEPGESGHDAVKMLTDLFEEDISRFSSLSSIWLHSTRIPEAAKMARVLEPILVQGEEDGLIRDVYVVVDSYSPNLGI